MSESMDGVPSTKWRDLVRRLKQERSWGGSTPDPNDSRFLKLFREMKKVSHITDMNLLGEDLGDKIFGVIGMAMVQVPFPHLRSLELTGNGVAEVGISALATAITVGHLPSLESLAFFPRREGDGRCRYDYPHAMNESQNAEYSWDCNRIEDKEVTMLATAFASGNASALKVLTLGQQNSSRLGQENSSRFGPEGAKALACEIQKGFLPSLEVLDLSGNAIEDEGIGALSKAFAESKNTLKVLDLEFCQISIEGKKALASAFMSGRFPALTELYLGHNSLKDFSPIDYSLIELATVLKNQKLPKLQILDVEDDRAIHKEVAEAFREALRSNQSLLALKINWPTSGPYENSVRKILERNRKIASIVQKLGQENVQATNGKIFLCGNPQQGKTTLRRSLQNDWPPYVTCFSREKKVRETPAMREIGVSHIVRKANRGKEIVRLAIWDLPGKPGYQALHNAFLPDLAFGHGQVTTFVFVCNANPYPKSDTGSSHNGKQVLLRWMRFIASGSFKGEEKGKRHVILVLNRFNNERCKYLGQWQEYLADLKELFHEYLEIYERPFVFDARVARKVRTLKKHLIHHTRQKLQTKKIPKICQHIQATILQSLKQRDFPVISWAEFAAIFKSSKSDEQKLRAAAEYLHESGDLIHFQEGWDDFISKRLRPGQSLVVLDPDWFRGKVVGYLLLPDENSMLANPVDNGEVPFTTRVRSDGSVALDSLKSHLQHILHDKQKVSYIVALLVRLGICYMAGTDKVFIPALISEDSLEGSHSSTGFFGRSGPPGLSLGPTDQWVIGYCLKVQYRATTLLPVAVFRRLQVVLAQDPMCTAADSEYAAGYSNITFKTNGMEVLVEFGAHEHDPNLDDRVDILVKPLVNRVQDFLTSKDERRELQIDLAQVILEKFVSLVETWSPGVEFLQLVVKPWCTAEGTLKMEDRNVSLSIQDARRRVEAGQAATSWTVNGDFVYLTTLLSGTELRESRTSVEQNCEMVEKLMADLGARLGVEVEEEDHPTEDGGEMRNQNLGTAEDDTIREQLNRIEAKIDNGFAHVRKDLGTVLDRQRDLLKKAQALGRFSKDQVRNSVPRFMYMTKARESSMWMPLKDIFVEKAILHFLCELHYNGQSVHEVRGQDGVEIKNLRKLAAKVLPWLQWSLQVAMVVGKVASPTLLPGLAEVMNTVNPTTSDPLRPMDVNCNDHGLKQVLTELIGEMKPAEFQSKFQLKRAVVTNSGYVVWICNDCFHKHHARGAVETL